MPKPRDRASASHRATKEGDRERFARTTGVSRETLGRFDAYAALIQRWQPAVNLIAKSTLDQMWIRHFLDSAQLFAHLPESTRILIDLGSGGGFPGLVLAILGVPEVHLFESDTRKAAFLRNAARQLAVPAVVHAQRIEQIQPFPADVVTARALAEVSQLLNHAAPFLRDGGTCLFLKGARVAEELTKASALWHISSVETKQSVSDPTGRVVRLQGIAPAKQFV